MTNSSTLTEFEEKLARSLREAPAEPTPDCYPEETLWDFAEQGGKHPDALNLIRHISSCAYCTQGYFAMKETLQLRQELAPAEEKAQEVTSPPVDSVPTLQERLHTFVRIPRVRLRLQLGGMALAGATLTLLVLWPRLTRKPFIPAPDAGLTRRLQQTEAELTRQSQQAKAEMQKMQETLEKKESATQQELKSLRAKEKLLNAKNQSHPTRPGEFIINPKSTEQIVTDGKGNSMYVIPADPKKNRPMYVIPIDPKESRPLLTGNLDLPKQQLAALAPTGEQTMGDPGEKPIQLLRPVGTFVSSLRPTFAWKPVPKASVYILNCIAKNSQAKPITYTVPAHAKDSKPDITWPVPPNRPRLQAATTYTWTVEAQDAHKTRLALSSTNEEHLFRTLTASQMAEIEHKSKQYMNDPFLMGALYARLGVLDEAEKAFARCSQANPNNDSAQKMQKQLRAQQMPRP